MPPVHGTARGASTQAAPSRPDGRDHPYQRPANMGPSAAQKRGTKEASIYGHADHLVQRSLTAAGMDECMDSFLAKFPVDHWRPRTGQIVHKHYSDVHQNSKKTGMMIMEPGCPKKFNVIMQMDDPCANNFPWRSI